MASSPDMYTPDWVTIRSGCVRLEGYLPSVTALPMLIVDGDDEPVIEMNRAAYRLLSCPKRLVIVPGASHLFEEPGTLEQVAEHALTWFQQHIHPTQHEGTDTQTKERLR